MLDTSTVSTTFLPPYIATLLLQHLRAIDSSTAVCCYLLTDMQDEQRLAPRSASPQYVLEAIRLAATLAPGDVFYDLGCGADARILIAMAQAVADDAQQQQQQQQEPSRHPAASCKPAAPTSASAVTAATAAAEVTTAAPAASPSEPQECLQEAAAAVPASVAAPGPQKFVGVELNPEAAAQAAATVAALPADVRLRTCIRILQGDLLQVPLHDATVIYAYLLPKGLALLAAKLSEEAPPSCTLLSYMFKVPGWEQHLRATLPVTSGMPGRPDVSGVSKLYVYRRTS